MRALNMLLYNYAKYLLLPFRDLDYFARRQAANSSLMRQLVRLR